MKPRTSSTWIALALLTLAAPGFAQITIENAFPNLTFPFPVDIVSPPDGTDRLFVVSQFSAEIWVFDNDSSTAVQDVFMDISDRVFVSGSEVGLLGLAFHPNYANNRFFYVSYTANNPLRVVISRFRATADPAVADPNSERILMELDQFQSNHNSHRLIFGSDNFLYIGTGDGGGSGDPQENGEDLTQLLGKILRIDVDTPLGPGQPYGIPADNPFVGAGGGVREEIWAYGIRNPWRFSFDQTGRLWLADVGQNELEEIDWVEPGLNYGWNTMEGTECFDPPVGCDVAGRELPIFEYPHDFNDQGGFSITGGYVYRGNSCPDLVGKYIYGDFVTENLWALSFDETGATANELIDSFSGNAVSAFGEDQSGELYFTDYGSTGTLKKFSCPGGGGIPCGDIQNFQARCQPGGRVQYRVIMTDNSHDGESVTFQIDGANDDTLVIANGRAQSQQNGFSAGAHTVTLSDPAGCFPDRVVDCP
jgi:glucose/arabinose dehydrogenase